MRLVILLIFTLLLTLTATEDALLQEQLKQEYDTLNAQLPAEQVSLLEVINDPDLYEATTGYTVETLEEPSALLAKIIDITDHLEDKRRVSVIVKLQQRFYPEGVLSPEEAQRQREEIIANVLPVVERLEVSAAHLLANFWIFENIPYFSLTLAKEDLWQLMEIEGIIDIELDHTSEASLTQSTPLIDATGVWNTLGFSGAGQSVAVLDTGVRKSHQSLSGKVVSEACYSGANGYTASLCPGGVYSSTATGSGVNCSTAWNGTCSHGTHVAGTIAGSYGTLKGVAPSASIIAIQVFSNNSGSLNAYDSDLLKALQRVYALRGTYDIAAVNMSLGGGRYYSSCDASSLKATIDTLLSAGIATVIASGNESYTDSVASPGCISSAITVGSSTDGSGGTTVDKVSSFSNSATMVDLLAPGQWIYAAVASGDTAYANYQGTSMATPHVAGAFALLKSVDSSMGINEMLTIIKSTGKSITDTRNAITKPRIDLYKAALQLGTGGISVTTSPASAQWRVDGGAWKNSGDTLSGLSLSTHALSFNTLTHNDPSKIYLTPAAQSLTLTQKGVVENVSVSYSEESRSTIAGRDLQNDGRSDILLRNTSTGQHVVMLMDGGTVTPVATKNNGTDYKPPYTSWVNKGLGDFDGDGKSDILLRNTSTGQHVVMLMDGGTVTPVATKKDGADYKPAYNTWVNQ